MFNPMSIFDITLVLLSICTNLTEHTAMVFNLSRPGTIRIMPKTCLCVTGFYLGYMRRSTFSQKKVFYFTIYSFN